ncbi:Homeobox-like_domain superfamily [Hexamita inflata]|uniref:Homeobox-like domain superfamily n=1 Tax=Hexamita inflata TaxID=28002 RepID=A0AA86V5Q3_9EUKA|nr:Homeobox-like domain superfamily [Hexamita inflata]
MDISKHARKFTEHDRQCIVDIIIEKGDTRKVKEEADKLFKCCRGSIQNIWNTYKNEGRIKPSYSKGVQKTFKKSDRLIIKNIAVGDPFLRNRLIAHRYYLLTGKLVSLRTITRILKEFE